MSKNEGYIRLFHGGILGAARMQNECSGGWTGLRTNATLVLYLADTSARANK